MSASFNLIDEPFIPCRMVNGTVELLNLRDALARAHEVAEIADSSPLTTFALYRFILVIVHRCLKADDWTDERLPMTEIEKYLTRWKDRFDLFGKHPFMQEAAGDEAKLLSASELIAELPTATNINHARHTQDDSVSLCPVCCARGLLRLAPFCGQGGQGKAPSINAPPPAYFLPLGVTLFDTLRLNAAALPQVDGDSPAWENPRPTSARIGPMEAFTWEPRTVRMVPCEADGTTCSLCGRSERATIHQIVFQKGRNRADTKVREWRDPHAAYAEDKSLIAPEVIQRTWSADGFWRKTAAVILRGEPFKSAAVESLGDTAYRVRVVSLHTRQAKVLHDRVDEWRVPPLTTEAQTKLLEQLEWLGAKLADVADKVVSRSDLERNAEVLFRRRLAGGTADEFRNGVCDLVAALTPPPADPARPLAVAAARRQIAQAVRKAFPLPEVPT